MSRALVLGGGGIGGLNWQAGLITGLVDAGVDLSAADLVVGTSAGSIAGAYITTGLGLPAAVKLGDVLQHTLNAHKPIDPGALLDVMNRVAAADDPREGNRIIGAAAVAADTIDEQTMLGVLTALHDQDWPQRLVTTTIDAVTGDFRVLRAADAVGLDVGVAASSAGPMMLPAISIDERPYMDGGLNSPLNAHVATGHDFVVAISCFPLDLPADAPTLMRAWATTAQQELAGLAAVEAITPGPEFRQLSADGDNLMNPAIAALSFEAGLHQAPDEASRIAAAWHRK